MPAKFSSSRALRQLVLSTLGASSWEQKWTGILQEYGPQKLVSSLFSALFSTRDTIHWHAVSCMGEAVSQLAAERMETARIVVRRLMWSLNDESGGIGWGAPEAMGEILARDSCLAGEYSSILLSYIIPGDGPDNYLEYAPLRQGAYWGIARLAQARPQLIQPWEQTLAHALQREREPKSLLLICLAFSHLDFISPAARSGLKELSANQESVCIYWQREFQTRILGAQAQEALAADQGHVPKS
jgi:hypothetical protein